jgi:SAM-dependent methyltransferase
MSDAITIPTHCAYLPEHSSLIEMKFDLSESGMRRYRRLVSLLVKRRRCIFCGWFGYRFEPFGNEMTYRADALCPICGSLERHRLAVLLLRDRIARGQKTLHVAPEPTMVSWLVSFSSEYLNVDLKNPAMQKMDLTNLELPDRCKTLVWCSHVLDDIPDDRKALSEMFRVLAPGGILVLQVTIGGDTTYEDPSAVTRAERLKKFLWEDHVRLYGRDLQRRVEEQGFKCQILSATDLSSSDQTLYAIDSLLYREVFFCQRPL